MGNSENKKPFYHAKTKYLITKFNDHLERKNPLVFVYAGRLLLLALVIRIKYKEEYLMNKYKSI